MVILNLNKSHARISTENGIDSVKKPYPDTFLRI